MDNSLWSIVMTFIIDVVIFIILLLLFLCLRKYRSRKPPGEVSDMHEPLVKEAELSLGQTIRKVWKATDADMLQHCGVEGLLYFKIHRNLAWLMAVLSVLGMVVLVTVYTQGNSTITEEVESAGIAHVVEEEDMLIASFLCLVLFTSLSSFLIYYFFRLTSKYHAAMRASRWVVSIDGIPGNMLPSEVSSKIHSAVSPLVSEGSVSVLVAKNWAKAYSHYVKLKPIRARKRELEEYYSLHPEAPKKRVGCCKKTDELETCKQKESALITKVEAAMTVNPKAQNSGTAFVVTSSNVVAAGLVLSLRNKPVIDDELKPKKWSVAVAKGGENVLWESQMPAGGGLVVKRILCNVIFFLVAFIFMSPTGFLQYVKLIFGSVGGDASEGFIGQYLPTIVMFIYMDILLPFFIEILVKLEQHRTHDGARISAMAKYSLFFVVYIYLTPLIGFQVVDLIDTLKAGNFGELLTKMESRFTKTGLFFFIFMIHAAFIKSGVLLLLPGVVIGRKLKEKKALVQRTKVEAYQSVEVSVPLDLTMSLLCVMMALSFAVIMPILLPITCIFLILKSSVQKYNLLCVTHINPNTGGELVFNSLSTFLVCVVFYQWLTCFVLMITGFASWLALGAIVAASTLVQIAVFGFVKRRRRRAVATVATESDEKQQFTKDAGKAYRHPMKNEFDPGEEDVEKVVTQA